jgi:hypothetical protein
MTKKVTFIFGVKVKIKTFYYELTIGEKTQRFKR